MTAILMKPTIPSLDIVFPHASHIVGQQRHATRVDRREREREGASASSSVSRFALVYGLQQRPLNTCAIDYVKYPAIPEECASAAGALSDMSRI